MGISKDGIKRKLAETGRELESSLRQAGAQAREAVKRVDVETLRRRVGAIEDRLNQGLDDLSKRARERIERWRRRR